MAIGISHTHAPSSFTMNDSPHTNIDVDLLSLPKCKRLRGEVISPLTYTNDIVDFDHWDHMFITNCCRSLTLHDFDGPPSTILDLGCGRGLWAIEAAKQWQGSIVVGFDIERMQPGFNVLEKSVSRRLRWVQGNLLEQLPFTTNQFDFVRMVRMGLHIPEDEWPSILAEIARILKPHGVLEIIEEDLLFPCQSTRSHDVTPSSGQCSGSSTQSSNTVVTATSYHESVSSLKAKDDTNTSLDTLSGTSSTSLPSTLDAKLKHPKPPDPQDHTRLQRAWEEMLYNYFLSPQLLSVLPLYLSLSFPSIRSHPPLQIPLPLDSSARQQLITQHSVSTIQIDPATLFELRALSAQPSFEADPSARASVMTAGDSEQTMSSWACMHLARTVRTIVGCKESIWSAYERLYSEDPTPRVVRTTQQKPTSVRSDLRPSPTNPLRDYFERDWINWENDMADRTSLRGRMRAELTWNEPVGKPPDWRLWRNSLPQENASSSQDESAEYCRSLRGFVCFKS
ncbi:uncharacterized protein F5891DRAFT_1009359 [Suillus fuscotomentosus]|uniref:Methyltransferase domain-containing protein n=1 Tax=Suillus fuscotomentosus TaxID=1912939 RepID=A0AAD4EI56_9AGAM|nr:uncharacterized protein F5891DRAFT_1009359 [Suillus fuscotomentosus]KAG1905449.1 hypothetical protein F5891DRAFT_1009359 [Suillus fuscotomentosus]